MRWLAALAALGAVGFLLIRRRGSGGTDGKPFTCPAGMTVTQDHRGDGGPQWSCESGADPGLPAGVEVVPAGHGMAGGGGAVSSPGSGYVWVTEPPPGHFVRASDAQPSTSEPLTSIEFTPIDPPVRRRG